MVCSVINLGNYENVIFFNFVKREVEIMDIREFNDYILLSKKAHFLEYVQRAAESIGAPIPKVNFEGCTSFDKDLAHIHIEQNKICISEHYLKRATDEDLRETATHEVTHIKDRTHTVSFRKLQASVKTNSWMREHSPEPSSEKNDINRYNESQYGFKQKSTDDRFRVKRCEYCGEEISKVTLRKNTGGLCDIRVPSVAMPFVCKFCGGSYCEDHRLPENHKCVGLPLKKSVISIEEITGGLTPLDDETKSLIFKRLEDKKEQDTEGKTGNDVQNNDRKLKEIEDMIDDLYNRYMASLISRDEYFDTLRSLNHEKRIVLRQIKKR